LPKSTPLRFRACIVGSASAADKRAKGSKSKPQASAKPSLTAKIGPPKTLAELRAENARLKAIIADLLMEKYNAA